MGRPASSTPTVGELSILKVLWEHGPCTVRGVQEALNVTRPTGYTTALKLLQIMTEKNLVFRDESQRAHVYHPQHSEHDTQSLMVTDLMERAFGGSAMRLVLHSLTSKKASPEELHQIRELIERLESDSESTHVD